MILASLGWSGDASPQTGHVGDSPRLIMTPIEFDESFLKLQCC